MITFCKQCGAEIDEVAKFCSKCGANQEGKEVVNLTNSAFTPTIEVTRESSFVECLLKFKVFIDGVEMGKLKNGEKKKFEILPGIHEIYIKLSWSWCYSPKVSFLLKDFTKFSCKPTVGLLGAIFGRNTLYFLFKRHKYISLKEVQ